MAHIIGKYQYVSNENFEAFANAMGHPELAAAFLQSKPVVEIQKNGDQWTIQVNSDGRTSTNTFKFNEPYDEKLPSTDRKFQSVTVQDGDKFKTETQVAEGIKIYRLYEFSNTDMKVHLTTNKGDIKATRVYKRL